MGLNGTPTTMTHSLSRKALYLLLSATLLLSVGCRKKPRRDPSQTVMSGQPSLNPSDAGPWGPGGQLGAGGQWGTDGQWGGNLQTSEPGLVDRGPGVLEDENTIRGLLQPVYFAFDQSAIAGPERAKLDAAKDYLDANPQQRLLIEGRADWRGTTDYNLGLGDRRANAAKQYLVTIGVPDTRVETISKGDLEAVENASQDVMAQDRRGDLVILKR